MPITHLPRALAVLEDEVVERAALVAAGVNGDLGDRLVRQGVWLRLAPSVYLAGLGPPASAQLVRAARLHVGNDLVVTGAVACRALGLSDVPDDGTVEVLIAPGTRAVSTAYVVVHQTERPPLTWENEGTSYACGPRSVIDAARRAPDLRTARALVLASVCQRLCTAADLRQEVEAGHSRGSGLARRAVDDALAGAWSAPEAEAGDLVRAVVREGRLPAFLLNPTLTVDGVRVGAPDGYLPGTGVGWQVDSRRHHGAPDDLDDTLAVHDRYAAHGLTLLHVTPRRLRLLGPHWAQLLVEAVQARGGSEPLGLQVRPNGPLQTGPQRAPLLGQGLRLASSPRRPRYPRNVQ